MLGNQGSCDPRNESLAGCVDDPSKSSAQNPLTVTFASASIRDHKIHGSAAHKQMFVGVVHGLSAWPPSSDSASEGIFNSYSSAAEPEGGDHLIDDLIIGVS